MKKSLIIMLLLSIFTVGCSENNNSSVAESVSEADKTVYSEDENDSETVECNWESDDETYEDIDTFVSYAKENMYYYDVETEKNIPIDPYVIEYDESKYEFSHINRTNSDQYQYVLREKETRNLLMIEFCHYCGYDEEYIASYNGIADVEGFSEPIELTEISNEQYAVKYFPETCCKAYYTYTVKGTSTAAKANISIEEMALQGLADLTIHKSNDTQL